MLLVLIVSHGPNTCEFWCFRLSMFFCGPIACPCCYPLLVGLLVVIPAADALRLRANYKAGHAGEAAIFRGGSHGRAATEQDCTVSGCTCFGWGFISHNHPFPVISWNIVCELKIIGNPTRNRLNTVWVNFAWADVIFKMIPTKT